MVSLQTEDNKYLGARFIEECSYIDTFLHEEQLGMIQQYAYVQHMKTALGLLLRGHTACLKRVIEPEPEDDDCDEDLTPVEFVFNFEMPKVPQLAKKTSGSAILAKLKSEGLF